MRKIVLIVALLSALPLAAAELVPHVRIIRGEFVPGKQPDGNTVILDAPEGLIVIDTGRHPPHTRAVFEQAKQMGRPIAAVINTHWHLDHIGGNVMVRQEYPAAKIYASDALNEAMSGFLANYRKQLAQMIAKSDDAESKRGFETEMALIDAGKKLAPDVVIARSGTRLIAGRELTIGLEQHTVTAGDVWVLDSPSGVLVAGDLVTLPAPFLDTACPERWRESLDRLAGLEFDLLVPGHGAPLTRRQFGTYQTAFAALLQCTAGQGEKPVCIDGWLSAIRPLMSDLDERFTRSLMAYYVDLLRGDPDRTKPLCGDE